jgi:hypothetical protein
MRSLGKRYIFWWYHKCNKKVMKKYILYLSVLASVMLACNQPVKEATPEKGVTTDSVKMPVDTSGTEMMKVSELSDQELKDDSVFANGSIPTSWKVAGITDVKGLKLFIKQLQQWVITNDKEKLAGVVQYPLNKTIKTKEDLLANYDAVFTKEVKLSFATIVMQKVL